MIILGQVFLFLVDNNLCPVLQLVTVYTFLKSVGSNILPQDWQQILFGR